MINESVRVRIKNLSSGKYLVATEGSPELVVAPEKIESIGHWTLTAMPIHDGSNIGFFLVFCDNAESDSYQLKTAVLDSNPIHSQYYLSTATIQGPPQPERAPLIEHPPLLAAPDTQNRNFSNSGRPLPPAPLSAVLDIPDLELPDYVIELPPAPPIFESTVDWTMDLWQLADGLLTPTTFSGKKITIFLSDDLRFRGLESLGQKEIGRWALEAI